MKNSCSFFSLRYNIPDFYKKMSKKRYLSAFVEEDIKHKMVFLGGPRQVGKTTLAEKIGEKIGKYDSLNWDARGDRKRILREQFRGDTDLLFFDELHKYPDWKGYMKGLYDKKKSQYKILLTGSARLNIYKKGGDSLLGRYHYYRLHPFSFAEYAGISPSSSPLKLSFQSIPDAHEKFQDIFDRGGFPEPLFSQNPREQLRWKNERVERIVTEDIRDLENVQKMAKLDITAQMLPDRVASLFSLNSLREDIGVSFQTMSHWIEILENVYYIFRIYPFQSRSIASLKKEPKLFLWDFSEVEKKGERFENCIASHLLKFSHFLEDVYGYKVKLHFLRDQEKREVDFLLIKDNKPWIAVEAKTSNTNISQNLRYFQKKLNIPYCYQVVKTPNIDFEEKGIRLISAEKFLTGLV
jgi:predicted AAA+ superfamily ATPase